MKKVFQELNTTHFPAFTPQRHFQIYLYPCYIEVPLSLLFEILFLVSDPETDFPGLADLQAALLNESSNDDALVSASEALLSAALQDPGASVILTISCIKIVIWFYSTSAKLDLLF